MLIGLATTLFAVALARIAYFAARLARPKRRSRAVRAAWLGTGLGAGAAAVIILAGTQTGALRPALLAACDGGAQAHHHSACARDSGGARRRSRRRAPPAHAGPPR